MRHSTASRCYPGKHPFGRGDRAPTPREIDLCRFWLDWDLRLLRPAVVVPVGGLAIRRLLMLKLRLDECIGSVFPFGEALAVPLPHPSGASGWLNDPANRKRVERAVRALRSELRSARALASA